ncbi:unnamed protein product [Moneuplotes crassus]|uniref:Uncharacterized protein n=1 Tax=Euplotes crassus TaxID=5936 RepID=A0AAD1X9V3_EUPCR|nr:unnamed protein product [Moneuplotes crassus]
MDSSNATPKKFQCSDPACKSLGEYFCRTHQMFTCKGCANNMHFKCELVIIQDLTDIRINVIEVKRFVKRLSKLTTENGLGTYDSNIGDVLKDFQDSLVEIEKKIKDAITHDHYEQFDTLQSQIKQVQIQMSDSNFVKDILYFSTLRDASLYSLPKIDDYLSSPTKVKKKIDAVIKENVELMDKKFYSKSRQFEQQCKARLTEELKDEIQSLKDLNDAKNTELEQSRKQHLEDQAEISKICEELKESESELEETKEYIKGLYKNICPDFNSESKELKLDMSIDKSKNLAKAMGACKYSLGDMNRLQIDNISNEDHVLNGFLKNCSQSSLRLLSFNHSYLGSKGSEAVKVKFYEEGMQKLFVNVTKEVYLKNLIVDASDLSQIVKACVNSERLIIRYSKISTSGSLDFSTPAQAKLQYLSFCYCGGDWCSEGWDKYPARFEKIIVAIKNCSFKNSLNAISVIGCKISVSKINELLAAHDLSHISAVSERNEPLTE